MSDAEPTGFLSLSDLTPDPQAARLLPLAVARRCRALPVAVDGGCITVAMADPTDRAARQAVTAALQAQAAGAAAQPPQVYLVQGDPALIDAWLADPALANDERTNDWLNDSPTDVWLWEPPADEQDALTAYAEQMAALLAAPLRRLDPLATRPDAMSAVVHAPRRLMILPCSKDYSLAEPWLAAGDGWATLFACRPRWPLRRLLLIVRGNPVDDAVLAWATLLTRAGHAAVTALMVAPHVHVTPVPRANDDIAHLLSPQDSTGHRTQRTVRGLAITQQNAVLHLRQGAPETVIRTELAAAPYDLVITGVAAREGAQVQWRLRPLLHKLLPELPCPLLVTSHR